MEIEAPESGVLDGVRFNVGDVVPVTEIIAYVLQPGESLPESKAVKVVKKTESPAPKTKSSKPAGVSISPVAQRLADENQIDISLVKGSGKGGQITKKDVEQYLAGSVKGTGKVKATPAARRIAKEKQVDLKSLSGSGPAGRIQAVDVERSAPSTTTQVAVSGLNVLKEIPLIGMRRTIAQNMHQSWQDAPHMVLQIDVEMDAAEGLRQLTNAGKTDKKDKISVTALIVKAAAWALKQNPSLNSQYTGEKVIQYSDINIGVATALDNGLIVPVIHHADTKDLAAISKEMNDLALRARESRLEAQDLTGGTFTISNLGMYGIDRFSAIINPPQAAILAVGKMNQVFLPDDQGQPVLRKVITFTLSADHRVLDGSQAAMYLSDLNKSLQNLGEILK
jgi:pyruvate dehydrogenase E2 component (dihydrolipoamide acetyltransferase)